MLKKKKTTASGKLVLVKSVRRTRSHRMKFCVQRGLGALPSTSKRRGKSRRDFLPCGPVCINTGIACQYYPRIQDNFGITTVLTIPHDGGGGRYRGTESP